MLLKKTRKRSSFVRALDAGAMFHMAVTENPFAGKTMMEATVLSGREPESGAKAHQNAAKSSFKSQWRKTELMLACFFYGLATGSMKVPNDEFWQSFKASNGYNEETGKNTIMGKEVEVSLMADWNNTDFEASMEKVIEQEAIVKMVDACSPKQDRRRGRRSGSKPINKAIAIADTLSAGLMAGLEGIEAVE